MALFGLIHIPLSPGWEEVSPGLISLHDRAQSKQCMNTQSWSGALCVLQRDGRKMEKGARIILNLRNLKDKENPCFRDHFYQVF